MHLILISPQILSSAHQLISSCTSPILGTLNPFLINNSHLIEVVLSKIQVFSCLRLHFFALVEIDWQLLNLEAVFVRNFVCHTSVRILRFFVLLVVVIEWNLRMGLIR